MKKRLGSLLAIMSVLFFINVAWADEALLSAQQLAQLKVESESSPAVSATTDPTTVDTAKLESNLRSLRDEIIKNRAETSRQITKFSASAKKTADEARVIAESIENAIIGKDGVKSKIENMEVNMRNLQNQSSTNKDTLDKATSTLIEVAGVVTEGVHAVNYIMIAIAVLAIMMIVAFILLLGHQRKLMDAIRKRP